MELMPSLFCQVDTLILSTFLERFGLLCLAAMFHRRLILTSSLPFVEFVCKDAAFYFDPVSPNSIFECILRVKENSCERERRVEKSKSLTYRDAELKYLLFKLSRMFQTSTKGKL